MSSTEVFDGGILGVDDEQATAVVAGVLVSNGPPPCLYGGEDSSMLVEDRGECCDKDDPLPSCL